MLIVAERSPVAEGSKRTSNVVEPPAATEAAGCVVTTKSAAWVPVSVTGVAPVSVSTPVPVFWMVKVRVAVAPVT